jgi:hypothetical protein
MRRVVPSRTCRGRDASRRVASIGQRLARDAKAWSESTTRTQIVSLGQDYSTVRAIDSPSRCVYIRIIINQLVDAVLLEGFIVAPLTSSLIRADSTETVVA